MKLQDIATALATRCSTELLSEILIALLTCDTDDRLTDAQYEAGRDLFECLFELSPEAAELSQTN